MRSAWPRNHCARYTARATANAAMALRAGGDPMPCVAADGRALMKRPVSTTNTAGRTPAARATAVRSAPAIGAVRKTAATKPA